MGIMFPFINPRDVTRAQQDIFSRPPRATDDVSKGYSVGDTWIVPSRSRGGATRSWRCARNSAGAAVWLVDRGPSLLAAPPLPMDVASGCIAGWGSIRLKASYSASGPIYDLQRESDGQAVTVNMVGGELDTATADLNALGSVNRIAQWYEQSGNNFHATASGAQRPILPPVPTLGSRRGVLFDCSVTSNDEFNPRQWLDIPAAVATSSQSLTVIAYFQPRHAFRSQPFIDMPGASAGQYFFFGIRDQTGSTGIAVRGARNSSAPRRHVALEPAPFAMKSDSSGVYIFQQRGAKHTATAAAVYSLAGGKIGGTDLVYSSGTTPVPGSGTLGALLVYNRALTDAEVSAVMASLDYHFGSRVQARGNIICNGDSITEGVRGTYYLSWPQQLANSLITPARVFNCGMAGGTISTMIGNVSTWSTLFDPSAPWNDHILAIGTNNLTTDTVENMKTQMETYLASIRALGTWRNIYVCTVLPRGTFNSNPTTSGARWLAWNDIVRSNAATWGVKVIDFSADPTFADVAVVNGPLFGDLTHPQVDGLGYVANIIRAYVDV